MMMYALVFYFAYMSHSKFKFDLNSIWFAYFKKGFENTKQFLIFLVETSLDSDSA
jgi:hypothetical protein